MPCKTVGKVKNECLNIASVLAPQTHPVIRGSLYGWFNIFTVNNNQFSPSDSFPSVTVNTDNFLVLKV